MGDKEDANIVAFAKMFSNFPFDIIWVDTLRSNENSSESKSQIVSDKK